MWEDFCFTWDLFQTLLTGWRSSFGSIGNKSTSEKIKTNCLPTLQLNFNTQTTKWHWKSLKKIHFIAICLSKMLMQTSIPSIQETRKLLRNCRMIPYHDKNIFNPFVATCKLKRCIRLCKRRNFHVKVALSTLIIQ